MSDLEIKTWHQGKLGSIEMWPQDPNGQAVIDELEIRGVNSIAHTDGPRGQSTVFSFMQGGEKKVTEEAMRLTGVCDERGVKVTYLPADGSKAEQGVATTTPKRLGRIMMAFENRPSRNTSIDESMATAQHQGNLAVRAASFFQRRNAAAQ